MSDDFSKKANEAKDKAKEALSVGAEKASAAKDKVHEKIKGLAFRGMVEKKVSAETRAKFPVLDKLIPLTNYIACGFVVLVVIVIVACTRGGGASSASGGGRAAPASDFTYDLTEDGKGVIIKQYTGNGGTLVIPAEIEGFPVVRLGNYAFYGEDDTSYGPGYNITSVVIPATVKEIDGRCFYWIENLKSVTIQGSGVVLGNGSIYGVFEKCLNLETLNIPNGDNVLIPGKFFADTITRAFRDCKKLPLAMRSRLKTMGFDEP